MVVMMTMMVMIALLWNILDFPPAAPCEVDHTSELALLKLREFMSSCLPYDTVSDVVESKVHQCQQNSDAEQDGLILPQEISF